MNAWRSAQHIPSCLRQTLPSHPAPTPAGLPFPPRWCAHALSQPGSGWAPAVKSPRRWSSPGTLGIVCRTGRGRAGCGTPGGREAAPACSHQGSLAAAPPVTWRRPNRPGTAPPVRSKGVPAPWRDPAPAFSWQAWVPLGPRGLRVGRWGMRPHLLQSVPDVLHWSLDSRPPTRMPQKPPFHLAVAFPDVLSPT